MGYLFSCLLCAILVVGCQDSQPVIGAYPPAGLASWYSPRDTASGEKPGNNALTAAMRRTDFGKYYKVCNVLNSKCVVVRHNDFGPSRIMFKRGRIIDLSKEAFARIADLKEGLIWVTITKLAPN